MLLALHNGSVIITALWAWRSERTLERAQDVRPNKAAEVAQTVDEGDGRAAQLERLQLVMQGPEGAAGGRIGQAGEA